MKKIAIYFVIAVLAMTVSSKNCLADAQDGAGGFSITPFFQDITLAAEQSRSSFSVEIANNTQNTALFKLFILDFGALDESGGVALFGAEQNLTNKYGLAAWAELDRSELLLQSGEKQTIQVTVQNTKELSPGGHYAAIVAKIESGKKESINESAEIALNPSFTSLMFLRKLGGELHGLELKDQEIVKNIFQRPLAIKLRFQNTGNVHEVPRGLVRVTDMFGREVARGIINLESALILPETARIFPITLRDTSWAIFPGRYKVAVEYRYDGKDDFTVVQQNINLIPIMPMLVILMLVILVWCVYFQIRKRAKDKQ